MSEEIKPIASSMCRLSCYERNQIDEILRARANEIALYAMRNQDQFNCPTYPASVQMALTREMERIRALADSVKVKKIEL